jgi:hypothetical protein
MNMKIFILGHGKSGTTVFLYKVAGGLPDCQAFAGGDPGKHLGNYQNAVYKHTYKERKGRSFENYLNHVSEVGYDRMIWMARDPRDVAISEMLYRWHKGYRGQKKQYQAYLELIQRKEQNPASVPFHEICRYIGQDNWPMTTEEVLDREIFRYQRMHDFVKNLTSEWLVFRYEDMIDKNVGALNNYLGFEIKDDAEIPQTTKKSKVARKKAYGDWRQWFTEEDVELYKPVYSPYMDTIGCDINDWALTPEPVISPEFSSLYVKGLIRKNTMVNIRNIKDNFKDLIKS